MCVQNINNKARNIYIYIYIYITCFNMCNLNITWILIDTNNSHLIRQSLAHSHEPWDKYLFLFIILTTFRLISPYINPLYTPPPRHTFISATKCSQVLKVNTPKLRKPNIIIYDVPEDISTDNLAATILTQNPELKLTMDSIRPKYSFKNKKQIKNIIAEVEPETWQILGLRKVKLGWQLCKVADYVRVISCFSCSKYGHQAQEFKGKESCPRCAGKH